MFVCLRNVALKCSGCFPHFGYWLMHVLAIIYCASNKEVNTLGNVYDCLQRCDAVWAPMFRSNIVPTFSALKIEAVCSYKTLVPT
jgi:hypothetical protein